MSSRAKIRKAIFATALFAFFFSALSPAFAALQFKIQPTAFAELCTPQGIQWIAIDDAPTPQPQHKAIHCAWCTSSTAQVAITGLSALWVLPIVSAQVQLFTSQSVPAHSAPIVAYHSQAPPALS